MFRGRFAVGGHASRRDLDDPAQIIATTGKRIGADLILLGTHRKASMDAFWARSVAPNVACRTRIPLLLAPLR